MGQIHRRRFLQGAAGAVGAVALGGPFQGFTALAGAGPHRRSGASGRSRTCATARSGCGCPRASPYRSFHDTEVPDRPRRRHQSARSSRRHGRLSGRERQRPRSCATTRSTTRARPSATRASAYDPMAQSGTTTIEVTPHGEVVHAFTSLNGTQMNCSGGRMPWGGWITCEETINGPDVGPDFTGVINIPLTKPHGFIFEVPAGGQSDRQPVTTAGRFAHEAVSFDPNDGILYLTEDNFGFPSGFYRYIPATNPMETGQLDNDGTAPDARGRGSAQRQPGRDAAARARRTTSSGSTSTIPTRPSRTRRAQTAPTTNDTAHPLRRGPGSGAGRRVLLAARGLGLRPRGRVLLLDPGRRSGRDVGSGRSPTATATGPARSGRITPDRRSCSSLYQSPGADTLDFPDNVTASPRGTLDPVRGQRQRQLSARAVTWRPAVRTSRSTGWSASWQRGRRDSTTSSPARRSARTARRCSSTSRRRAAFRYAIWGPWERIGV